MCYPVQPGLHISKKLGGRGDARSDSGCFRGPGRNLQRHGSGEVEVENAIDLQGAAPLERKACGCRRSAGMNREILGVLVARQKCATHPNRALLNRTKAAAACLLSDFNDSLEHAGVVLHRWTTLSSRGWKCGSGKRRTFRIK